MIGTDAHGGRFVSAVPSLSESYWYFVWVPLLVVAIMAQLVFSSGVIPVTNRPLIDQLRDTLRL